MRCLTDGAGRGRIHLRVLHGLHGAIEGRAQRCKADEHVHVGVLLHGVAHVLIHGEEDLFVAPVELLLVVSAERTKRTIRIQTPTAGKGWHKLLRKGDMYVNG